MPAGKWDQTFNISEYGFVEWPGGTLELKEHEEMLWIEAWVMQQSSGAVQMTYQAEFDEDSGTWTAANPRYPEPWTNGKFKEGAALGTAIAISKKTDTGEQLYYWWTQEVELVE